MFDAKKLLDTMVASKAQPAEGEPGTSGNVLGDLLGKLQQGAGGQGGLGGFADMAKQVLGQATGGVKDAAGKIDQSTGAGAKIDDLVKQLSGGQGSADLIARAKDMISKNPAAAGALATVLGGLLIGTKTGRGLSWDAAKLGGLVLVGGLAYKAYQNYQAGKPPLEVGSGPEAAPAGSGFSAEQQSQENAALYLRAMIAAAAADGTIDQSERQKIIGGFTQVGMDGEATQFLEREFANPASVRDLAAAARTPEVRAQVYTAARMTIDPDQPAERRFLGDLEGALGLDHALVDHIDAEVAAARA
ncbi:MAG: DUF533 domain-containing protein [Hyphomicrobiaceae bacterium]